MARQRGKYWQGDVKLPEGTRSRPTFDTKAQAEDWEEDTREALLFDQPLPKPAGRNLGRPLLTAKRNFNRQLPDAIGNNVMNNLDQYEPSLISAEAKRVMHGITLAVEHLTCSLGRISLGWPIDHEYAVKNISYAHRLLKEVLAMEGPTKAFEETRPVNEEIISSRSKVVTP